MSFEFESDRKLKSYKVLNSLSNCHLCRLQNTNK